MWWGSIDYWMLCVRQEVVVVDDIGAFNKQREVRVADGNAIKKGSSPDFLVLGFSLPGVVCEDFVPCGVSGSEVSVYCCAEAVAGAGYV